MSKPKKLIEVTMPVKEISAESVRVPRMKEKILLKKNVFQN